MNKTKSAITRAEFRESAQPVEVVINGNTLRADVKEFSTGSLGWYLNAKTSIDVGGKMVSVQIGLNLTIVGSKDLPKVDIEILQLDDPSIKDAYAEKFELSKKDDSENG